MLTALLAVPLLVTALVPAVHANPHHAPAHSEQAGLHRRATYSCTATTDCTSIGYVLPANSHYYCRSKVCSYNCNSGFTLSGTACVSSAATATTTTAATTTTSATTTATTPAATSPSATPKLLESWYGSNFLDKFWFYSGADPTHGTVNYTDRDTAVALGLFNVTESGTVILKADSTSALALGSPRNSVRISSWTTINPGRLVIYDIKHAPYGCSVWPAVWTLQVPWPDYGEIDVMESINLAPYNQYTLHTTAGCTRSGALTGTGATGDGLNCLATGPTSGCTVFDYDPKSFGAGFNAAGGGVFALLFAETGISIWRWERSAIPADIKRATPRWKTWGTPVAAWDGATCDIRKYFKYQTLTFNIDVGGDWPCDQSVWQNKALSGACYSQKYRTCAAAIRDPANFKEAYFEINSVRIFSV